MPSSRQTSPLCNQSMCLDGSPKAFRQHSARLSTSFRRQSQSDSVIIKYFMDSCISFLVGILGFTVFGGKRNCKQNAVNAIGNRRDANGTAGIQSAQQGAAFAYSENSRNGKQIAARESFRTSFSFTAILSYRKNKSLSCKPCSPKKSAANGRNIMPDNAACLDAGGCSSHFHPRKLIPASHEETGR